MDKFDIAEQAYKNGYERGLIDGLDSGYEKGYADAKNELVRCKDCMHRYTASSGVIFCTQHITVSANDDDFCSYGERREGE